MSKKMDKILSRLAILRTWAKVNPIYGKGWKPTPMPIKGQYSDEHLLALADGIRMFIKHSGGYDKVQLIIEKSMAEYLAERIEEICKKQQ